MVTGKVYTTVLEFETALDRGEHDAQLLVDTYIIDLDTIRLALDLQRQQRVEQVVDRCQNDDGRSNEVSPLVERFNTIEQVAMSRM
jgi:hypothetical protein